MDKYSMIFGIVFVVMCAGVLKSWLGVQRQKTRKETVELDEESKGRIADLEERVKVLERIATSKTTRLKEEIDAL